VHFVGHLKRVLAIEERFVISVRSHDCTIKGSVAWDATGAAAGAAEGRFAGPHETRLESNCSGRRIMVIPKLPKLEPWVRFPSPAPLRTVQRTSVRACDSASVMAAVSVVACLAQGMEKPNVAPGPSLATAQSCPL
jgi:hypothetical protein